VCCSGPNLAADACVDGVPTDCDYNCALILIPWFEDCSTLIGQLAGEQFGAYENAYNRCKQTDAPDLWMQIHNLQEQGCTVPLPAGDVATDAANNAAADACNLSGAPVHIDTCTASSEYSDDYTCDHVFDAEFEDLWYGDNDVRTTAGSSSSWATRGGDDNRPWIELNFGRMAEIGSMSYAQRTNVGGECFQDVQLAFDDGATANLVLQCTSDAVSYSFPAVSTTRVRITAITIYGDRWINPGAREIEFYQFVGVHEAPLPLSLPPHGFSPGASLACFGTWDANDDNSRFSVNLRSDNDDTALHINPRMDEQQVIRNTKRGKAPRYRCHLGCILPRAPAIRCEQAPTGTAAGAAARPNSWRWARSARAASASSTAGPSSCRSTRSRMATASMSTRPETPARPTAPAPAPTWRLAISTTAWRATTRPPAPAS